VYIGIPDYWGELEIPFVSWGLFLKKEVPGRKRELQISLIRAVGREE